MKSVEYLEDFWMFSFGGRKWRKRKRRKEEEEEQGRECEQKLAEGIMRTVSASVKKDDVARK